MIDFSKVLGRPQPPDSYESWSEVVIPHYLYLRAGRPDPPDVETFKKWLKSFDRWKAGYDGFLEIERSLGRSPRSIGKRSYEYHVALLLQSGQWHAALLLTVKDVSEPERAKFLGEIDGALTELRKRLKNP